jgi:hypothetical protein
VQKRYRFHFHLKGLALFGHDFQPACPKVQIVRIPVHVQFGLDDRLGTTVLVNKACAVLLALRPAENRPYKKVLIEA